MNENVPQVPHTEFEGYKAITRNVVNNFPTEVNGLKNALTPQNYKSPMRLMKPQLYSSNSQNSLLLPPLT